MTQVNASGSDGFSLTEQLRATSVDPTTPQAPAQSLQARFLAGAQLARPDQAILEELETTRQLLQSQQGLIESLTEKLGSSQARVDQLESELTLAQQNHTDKSYLLQETETACLDLRARLFRQQRQTFQFKAALEKCLESSKLQPPLAQDDASESSAVGLRSPLHSTSVSTANSSGDNLDPGHSLVSRSNSLENSLVGYNLEASPPAETLPWVASSQGGPQGTTPKDLEALKAIQRPEPPSDCLQLATEMAVPASEMLSVSTHKKPYHLPLVFLEQPIQPWSIASGANHATTMSHQPVVESTCTPQATLTQPNYSTGLTRSVLTAPKSPLENPREDFLGQPDSAQVPSKTSTPRVSPPSPCRSKRKSLADVQLPCFPRRA